MAFQFNKVQMHAKASTTGSVMTPREVLDANIKTEDGKTTDYNSRERIALIYILEGFGIDAQYQEFITSGGNIKHTLTKESMDKIKVFFEAE